MEKKKHRLLKKGLIVCLVILFIGFLSPTMMTSSGIVTRVCKDKFTKPMVFQDARRHRYEQETNIYLFYLRLDKSIKVEARDVSDDEAAEIVSFDRVFPFVYKTTLVDSSLRIYQVGIYDFLYLAT